ncbi:uncharacterized protein METZ01_LOCUS382081, partial [marine metagenome]
GGLLIFQREVLERQYALLGKLLHGLSEVL